MTPSAGGQSVHVNLDGGVGDPFLTGRNTKFRRFYTWQLSIRGVLPGRLGSSLLKVSFPCVLPFPEVVSVGKVLRRASSRKAVWAKRWVNCLFSFYSFVEMGCPDQVEHYEPRGGFYQGPEVRAAGERLLGEIMAFSTTRVQDFSHKCESGGKEEIQNLLTAMEDPSFQYFSKPLDCTMTTALPVHASRIAVPTTAGTVDMLRRLPPERAKIVADLERLRMPEHLWNRIPIASHQVEPCEEADVARRLLQSKMVVPVRASELPRDRSGRLMLGGLFSVGKNNVEDRLIFDRRPENATMEKLHWAELPSGACYTRMVLLPHQYLRGSGEDLRNFYYNLELPPGWVRYNGFGRRLPREILVEEGLDPREDYRLCFRALGMGDTNACSIAQAVHEHVLQTEGLLKPSNILRYGRSIPRGRTWQGVYLDDLLVTQVCDTPSGGPVGKDFSPPPPSPSDPDMVEIQKAHRAYEKAGLPRAEHKAFVAQPKFKAWGAEIDGIEGSAAAPLTMRRDLWSLLRLVLKTGLVSKKIMQKLLGYICFCFQYRREFFSLIHRGFVFTDELKEDAWSRLPSDIADELRAVALHLPLAVWHMRRGLSTQLVATDATPSTGGSTVTNIPMKLAKELFRRSEYKGKHVRLDVSQFEEVIPGGQEKGCSDIDQLAKGLHWTVQDSYSFRQTSHVNLQELRAIKCEIKRWANNMVDWGQIRLLLTDSKVCLGCVGKGRSSSRKINGILRSMLGYLVMGDFALGLCYVHTTANPADHPSRFTDLPPPERLPSWTRRFGLQQWQGFGYEVFAGSARITQAHLALGIPMLEPVDILWGKDVFAASVVDPLLDGRCNWLWLAPPCSSFSPLRNLDPDGPLRPAGLPQGDESNPFVRKGNQLWRRGLQLARLAHQHGIPFAIEHPRNSRAWQLVETLSLKQRTRARWVKVDWCQYRGWGDMPNKKATLFLTTIPWLNDEWCKTCQGDHDHGKPLRGVRAKLAGAYPNKFCNELARRCLEWKRP